MKSSKLRVASVGLGWVTTHRHIPTMRRCGTFELVGLIDRAPGRAQAEARRLGVRHSSAQTDLAQIPWLQEVDALTIGTSPFSHYELIKAALLLDKHVLTEKPFTMRVEEGAELVALARQRQRVLAIVHNFQFARSTGQLLADLQSQRLGAIKQLVGWQWSNPRRRLPTWYNQLPLGLFYDESPHLLYLLRRLAPGPLQMLDCVVVPDAAGVATPHSMMVHYAAVEGSGRRVPVQLNMNFQAPLSEWHMMVLGEEAAGIIDIFRDIYLRLPNDQLHTTGTVLRTSLAATSGHWLAHIPSGWGHLTGRLMYGNIEVFRRFYQGIREGRPPEGISAEDALAILQMQHEIITAQRQLA